MKTGESRERSPRFKARIAGLFWLMTMLLGGFAAFNGDKLVVSGDAATTANNILTHESLFRWAVVTNLVATICYLAATLLLYFLLKPVDRNLSLLAVFFSLAGCAVSGVSFVLNLAPLAVLGGAPSENVASGVQYALQPSHPLPSSQASKNALAVSVIDTDVPSDRRLGYALATSLTICGGCRQHKQSERVRLR